MARSDYPQLLTPVYSFLSTEENRSENNQLEEVWLVVRRPNIRTRLIALLAAVRREAWREAAHLSSHLDPEEVWQWWPQFYSLYITAVVEVGPVTEALKQHLRYRWEKYPTTLQEYLRPYLPS